MNCPFCEYTWKNRTPSPVECPRCKRRVDHKPKKRLPSIPIEKADVLTKFCEIARREAGPRGFSEVALKAIEEYVKNHEEGNPQLKLTPYMDDKASGPARVFCHYIDGVISDGRIHCRKASMWIKGLRCYPCEHNQLRKKP